MNDIKFNNSTPSKMFWGASEINAAYYGNEKIYPFETPQVDDWDMLAVYNVTDITDSTKLLGDTGYLESKIWIDDEEQNLTSAYLFSTLGEHTVKYKFSVDEYQKTSLSSRFQNVPNLISLTFHPNVANVILTRCDRVFLNCTNLTTINGLEYLNTSNVTSLENMFNGCAALTSIEGVENWNTSSVTNMMGLFQGCSSLTSIDLSNWSASNVIMGYMFADCTALTEVRMNNPIIIDIANSGVYNMFSGISTNGTFYYNGEFSVNGETDFTAIINVLPSTWTSVDTNPIWYGYDIMATFDVTEENQSHNICFATNSGTSLSSTNNIYGSWEKITIDEEEINLQNYSSTNILTYAFSTVGKHTVKYKFKRNNRIGWAFYKCTASSIDVSKLDLIELSATTMPSFFRECPNLSIIEGLENLIMWRITSIQYMFQYDTNLTNLEGVYNWDTSSCIDMLATFSRVGVSELNLSSWDMDAVINMSWFADSTPNLTYIEMDGGVAEYVTCNNWLDGNTNNGTFKYNSEYDYSKLIAALPSTWVAEELPPRE